MRFKPIILFYLIICHSLIAKTIIYRPHTPLYFSKKEILVQFPKQQKEKILHYYSRQKWQKPEITFQRGGSLYALTKSYYYQRIQRKFSIRNISYKRAFFRQYAKNYQQRYERGFKTLKDLISGYKDNRLNKKLLQGVSNHYPDLIQYENLGKTRLGRDIPAVRISLPAPQNDKITILFNGAHHSNELISTEHCYDILYQILTDRKALRKLLEQVEIWIVPIVNPDGSYFFWNRSLLMGRKNGYLASGQEKSSLHRGVDLNRNYPFKWHTGQKRASSGHINSVFYRGPTPGSEPETRAIMALIERERFTFSISFHSYATCILFPYTIEEVTNPQPDYVKKLAEILADRAISTRPDKRFVAKKNIYAVDGTDQDYFYFQYGTNALLVESSHHNPKYEIAREVMAGFKEVWLTMLYEAINGEKLVIRIVNEAGKPLQATVNIKEIKYAEEENHTSNPLNGMFYKMVTQKGNYHITIRCRGYYPKKISIPSTTNLKPRRIFLKKIEPEL